MFSNTNKKLVIGVSFDMSLDKSFGLVSCCGGGGGHDSYHGGKDRPADEIINFITVQLEVAFIVSVIT